MKPRIGVCSWSLRPSSPKDLVDQVRATGLSAVQLALDPLRTGAWDLEALQMALAGARIELLSGMMGCEGEDYATLDSIRETGGLRPDDTWNANLQAAQDNARLARALGLSLVTFHAGFLPHERGHPERAKLVDRLRQVAAVFAGQGVRLGLETGQEAAPTLLEVLAEVAHPALGVNFDPANMILYGMGEPVAAVRALAPQVLQVHVKDALPAQRRGTWGSEVPVGSGAVDWSGFFAVVCPLGVPFVIEREAGETRVADIRTAKQLVEQHCHKAKP